VNSRSLIAIGKIVKAFGIRGDVVVLPMTHNAARFKKLKRVFVGAKEAESVEANVSHVVVESRGVRLQLSIASDRTAAEKIVGSLLFVDEKDSVRPPKGTFFIHDLVGLNVVDETENTIGILKDVLKYPANDVYVVVKDGKEILLPAVKEFIKKIDLETRTMRVKLIDGMLGDATADDDRE
jgi:16S rRNA processing protein RimM